MSTDQMLDQTDDQIKSKDEMTIVERFNHYLNEAKQYRAQLEPDRLQEEKFYLGKQWKNNEKRPVKNWCFQAIEQEVPILTDSKPCVSVISHDQKFFAEAEMLDAAIKYVLKQNKYTLKVAQAIRSMLKVGDGWMIPGYEPREDGGEGKITWKNIHWRFVYCDPTASNFQDGRYFIMRMPVPVETLKLKYPELADKIFPAAVQWDLFDNHQSDGWISNQDPGLGVSMTSDYKTKYASGENTIVEEMYLRDFSTEPIPEEETMDEIVGEYEEFSNQNVPDTNFYQDHARHLEAHARHLEELISANANVNPEEVQMGDVPQAMATAMENPDLGMLIYMIRDHMASHEEYAKHNKEAVRPKFKSNMRHVIKCGDTVLYDGSPEVDDAGMFPACKFEAYKDEDCVYAFGELKQIIPVQKSFNEMDYAEMSSLRYNSNTGWVIDVESGVNEKTLTNAQGIVVKKKTGTEVKRIEAAQTSPQLALRKAEDKASLDAICGQNEASQGKRPIGVNSAKALEDLKMQAIGRMRLKSRGIEEGTLPDLGQLTANRIMHYWTSERMLHLRADDGNTSYVYFDPDKLREMKYTIEFVPGSSEPINRETIYGIMRDLMVSQVIDPITFFTVTDLPYKTLILKKLQEQQLMAQQAAMQEQAVDGGAKKEQNKPNPKQPTGVA